MPVSDDPALIQLDVSNYHCFKALLNVLLNLMFQFCIELGLHLVVDLRSKPRVVQEASHQAISESGVLQYFCHDLFAGGRSHRCIACANSCR
jgi:hypothetical protein